MSQNGSNGEEASEAVVWLSMAQTLRRTGLSRVTLLKKINEGELRAYRPARNFRFKQHEVDEFIERSRVRPGDLDETLRRGWLPDYKRP